MIASCLLFLTLLLLANLVKPEFLIEPIVKWTYDIDNKSIRRGNAVRVTPDGSRLLVTASDGSLTILHTGDRNRVVQYQPESDSTCSSGAVWWERDQFAVHSYSQRETTSLVVAVALDGSVLWETSLPGVTIGNPFVSERGIYITHVENQQGYLSVLSLEGDLLATLGQEERWPRLTAVTGRTVNDRDVIVFAENQESIDDGSLWMVLPSDQYEDLEGKGSDAYTVLLASGFPLSAASRPALGQDGSTCFLGQPQSSVMGWYGNRGLSGVLQNGQENAVPRWVTRLTSSQGDAALSTAPILSPDETLLVVTTVVPSIYAVELNRGSVVWQETLQSQIISEPIVVDINNEMRVYSIESETGTVLQYDERGQRLWEVDCTVVLGECDDLSVEADFSTTLTANTVYYAYTNGTVVALSVASFETEPPTAFPTMSPGVDVATNYPAATPSLRPTRRIVNIDDEVFGVDEDQASDGPDLPLILGAAVGGLLFLVLLASALIWVRRGKRIAGGTLTTTEEPTNSNWKREERAYKLECDEAEQQIIQEITARKTPKTTPIKTPRRRSNSIGEPKTPPMTLDSIAESPDDDEDGASTLTGGDAPGAGFEVSLSGRHELNNQLPESAVRNLSLSFQEEAAQSAGAMVHHDTTPNFVIVAIASDTLSDNASDQDNVLDHDNIIDRNEIDIEQEDIESVTVEVEGGGEKGNETVTVFDDPDASGRLHSGASQVPPAISSSSHRSPVQNRPISPDLSLADLISIDGSLYLDEEAPVGVNRSTSPCDADAAQSYVDDKTTFSDAPDDEPGRIRAGVHPPAPSPMAVYGYGAGTAASRFHRPSPSSAVKDRFSRASERGPVPVKAPSSDRVRPIVANRMPSSSSARSKGRPRAGLFSRQQPLANSSSTLVDSDLPAISSRINDDGYVQEREGRAAYSPTRAREDADVAPKEEAIDPTSSARKNADVGPKEEATVPSSSARKNVVSSKKSSRSSTRKPASEPESAWNTFLNELSRVEEQFFNPTGTRRSKSPPPPPPPGARRRRERQSSTSSSGNSHHEEESNLGESDGRD